MGATSVCAVVDQRVALRSSTMLDDRVRTRCVPDWAVAKSAAAEGSRSDMDTTATRRCHLRSLSPVKSRRIRVSTRPSGKQRLGSLAEFQHGGGDHLARSPPGHPHCLLSFLRENNARTGARSGGSMAEGLPPAQSYRTCVRSAVGRKGLIKTYEHCIIEESGTAAKGAHGMFPHVSCRSTSPPCSSPTPPSAQCVPLPLPGQSKRRLSALCWSGSSAAELMDREICSV